VWQYLVAALLLTCLTDRKASGGGYVNLDRTGSGEVHMCLKLLGSCGHAWRVLSNPDLFSAGGLRTELALFLILRHLWQLILCHGYFSLLIGLGGVK
jgi:hypothetical protein